MQSSQGPAGTGPTSQESTSRSAAASTQASTRRVVVPLPANWHGHYKGTISFARAGKPSRETLMELTITPLPKSASVSWTIAFEDAGVRREHTYQLDPIPGYPDHHLMDDKNNGFTDQALVNNALIGLFNVPGSIVYSRFERVDAGIEVEIGTFQAAPSRDSGVPGVPVKSYPLVYIQRGTLKAVEPPAQK